MQSALEKLTIGIPVYNDAKYIRLAIESCLNEGGKIVVSDNASTDGTSEICAEFARSHPHLTHLRQAENIGAFENFKQLLFSCNTEYFAWFGSHDLLAPGYSLPLLAALERDPSAVLAVGTIQHIGEKGEILKRVTRTAWADQTNDSNPLKRVGVCVAKLRDCFIFYGIFRTKDAREAWMDIPSLGFDRVMIIRAAGIGKIVYVPESTFYARDFNLTRDSKRDQERRTFELVKNQQKPLPKTLFTRNMEMVKAVLALAKTPEDLTLALKIVDKINRRFQNRRYYQKLRLMWAAVAFALVVVLFLSLHPF